MDNLLVEACGKLFVLIFLFALGITSIILIIKTMRKKENSIPMLLLRSSIIIFCFYFGLLSGIPALKQINDISTDNFASAEGHVDSIRDCPFEKGGVFITIEEIEYVLIPKNNIGVNIGDYVSIEYGVVSKAIIEIVEIDDN